MSKIGGMGRYRYTAYDKDTVPRYVVVWDLQWSVVESQQLEPGSDLSAAMMAAIERLTGKGWQPEGHPNSALCLFAMATCDAC